VNERKEFAIFIKYFL